MCSHHIGTNAETKTWTQLCYPERIHHIDAEPDPRQGRDDAGEGTDTCVGNNERSNCNHLGFEKLVLYMVPWSVGLLELGQATGPGSGQRHR